MFHANSSSNSAKYLKFYGQKVESTRNANFGDYPGDIRPWSGDREIRSKIRSLPDYAGKLTALHVSGYGTYPRLAVRSLPMFSESKAWEFHLASDRGFWKHPINFGRFMLTSEHCRKCPKMFGRPMSNPEAIWKTTWTILACFDFVRTQSHYSAPFWNNYFCGNYSLCVKGPFFWICVTHAEVIVLDVLDWCLKSTGMRATLKVWEFTFTKTGDLWHLLQHIKPCNTCA